MPFQFPPRRPPGQASGLPVLASVLAAAGIALTVAGCSQVTPLGPDAVPRPSQLRSPIVLEAMRVQNPATPGKCPAGYAEILSPGGPTFSGPGLGPTFSPCYRALGPPVTFTSAAVTPYQPRNPAGQSGPPGESGLLITLPAADVAALTALTTTAYNAHGAVEISVAGKAWALPMAMAPLTHGRFALGLPSSQALQLQRLLGSSS